jgi:sulfane dehydrogenase subunit SoxC
MGPKETPMDSKRTNRRDLLKSGAALAGGLTLGDIASLQAQAHDHPPTPGSENASPMIMGSKELVEYGQRSRYVTSVRIQHPPGGRPSPDVFGKVFHVASPLQDSVGVITPSSLHYVATTRGSYMPDIDPKQHTLTIHGLLDQPLTLTMDDLKRFPSVTRLHFIECAGNRHTPKQKTVQETHGMTSCAEWTGVLLSTLLKECGLKGSATWFVAEGAEGIFHTKYLRRIKVVDRYYMNYNDFGHLRQDPREAALSEQIGPKSVITYPSGGQQLPGRGFYEISGLAWSGGGAIKTVEVSTDGGKKWNLAELKTTPQRMAHVRFGYQWTWDGKETEILSRATDEIGQVQALREQIAQWWNVPAERNYRVPGLDNSIMPWKIAKDGSVTNGLA